MKRKTKIVATLGPASADPDNIKSLIKAGVNVFRLNFSHGSAEDHQQHVSNIRTVAAELGELVGILQDLQGPKIRVGQFPGGPVMLRDGAAFNLFPEGTHAGDETGVGISYPNLYQDVQSGDRLLLDDGKLTLEVTAVADQIIQTRIIRGGLLSDKKGINVPDADLSIAAVTEKDIADIATGARLDVDWVALSFVRNKDDLLLARKYLAQNNSTAKLMAKIEKPGAIRNYKHILKAADGIMVARGDLGVELSAEKVPMLQKRLIRKAREKGKPVITATQMLETMTEHPIPTRAEANDVANAIFDGTDAVMLSAETATGKHPVQAVATMDRIAKTVESDSDYKRRMRERKFKAEKNTPDAVSSAACNIATTLSAAVMCCFSSSGATALRVARNRIHTDIIAISPSIKSCHQLTVSWGVNPVLNHDATSSDEMVEIASQVIKNHHMANAGDHFVVTAGVPFGQSGTTNLIRVETL
ncbi:pyruvate kinase [Marinicella sediminis]|uniref:Pyruvate kinase n=1 Tax=Marinicella sediminis TaxID=1792834 RepID=A0ABV7J4Q6_9GAMM|nr:pyruvate kinase [Marinicella sediminis]